jgi:inner membrane protein
MGMKFHLRIAAMAVVAISLLAALMSVRNLVHERQNRSREVQAAMATYSAGAQSINGPLLVFPYRSAVTTWVGEGKPGSGQGSWTVQRSQQALVLSAKSLKVDGQLASETLKRGIFEARVFSGPITLSGNFELPAVNPAANTSGAAGGQQTEEQWGEPMLVLGLGDTRGIRSLEGRLAEERLRFTSGTGASWQRTGVHALAEKLPAAASLASNASLPFEIKLELAGSEGLLMEPSAEQTRIDLRSNWQHPSFTGSLAPSKREVSDAGFNAQWTINQLATGSATMRCKNDAANANRPAATAALLTTTYAGCERVAAAMVGVNLIDPVDRYMLSERTLKYAELFLLVVFGAVFVMEVVRRVAVHPVQYALVGAALALFFLLTLALSEHLPFWQAYWGAALACSGLLTYYASHVMRGKLAGAIFGALVTGLFGVLYAILQSESMALLLGSVALFALLASIMVLTRHVDWSAMNVLPSDVAGKAQPDGAL